MEKSSGSVITTPHSISIPDQGMKEKECLFKARVDEIEHGSKEFREILFTLQTMLKGFVLFID